MESTWNHPTLGTFEHDSVAWNKVIEVPSFAQFSYDSGESEGDELAGWYELGFNVEDETHEPSQEAVQMVELLLANQTELVGTIVNALWNDFNGEGPDSGMWWHGSLEEVTEGMDSDIPLDAPDDLLSLLQVTSITVHTDVEDHNGPLIEVTFNAPFEEEHGVGVLTDGKSVFGTGYSVSVGLFAE